MGVVAVTGATGHVGVNLCRALAAEGRELRTVGRRPLPAEAGVDGAEWAEADVRDAEAVHRALAGAETVFHLAARISVTGDPDGSVWATNVEGTRNVVEAALANGVRRLVHCSSIHSFDCERHALLNPPPRSSWKQRPLPPPPLDESAAPSQRASLPVYARSKAAADEIVREGVARGLAAVTAAPTGIVGPHDLEPSRLGSFLAAVARRVPLVLVSGGFDWVDVRDVAEGLLAAERAGRSGETYLLGGEWASLRRLARLVANANGVQPPSASVPLGVARLLAPAAAGVWSGAATLGFTPEAIAALRWAPRVSHEKAAAQLGYQPRALEATAHDLVEWLVATGRIRRRGEAIAARANRSRGGQAER